MIGPTSKKYIQVDLPQSVIDISSMLELIKNKKDYQKYIDQIIDLTSKANASIETLAKAEDIEAMHDDMTVKHGKVDSILTEAEDKASKILADAESRAKLMLTASQQEANELNEASEETLKEAERKKADAEESMKTAKQMLTSAQSLSENLDVREKHIEEVEAEINRKKELLSKL